MSEGHKSGIGQVLRELREKAGYSQEGLGERIKRSFSTISMWESENNGISSQELARLLSPLGLDEPDRRGELAHLLKLHRPALDWEANNGALVDTFVAHNGLLNLDAGRLAGLPEEKRFGALLKVCCEKSDLSIMEIDRRSGVSEVTIRKWQNNGDRPSDLQDVFKVAETIGLLEPKNQENLKQLLSFAQPEFDWNMDASRLQKAFQHTHGLVSLDKEWLDLQAPERKFGLYIGACMESTKTPRDELAEKLNITRGAVTLWVRGGSKPHMKELFAAAEEMGILLTQEDTAMHEKHARRLKRLLELYDPQMNWTMNANVLQTAFIKHNGLLSLEPAWLNQQDEDKRFGLYLAACQASAGVGMDDMCNAAGRGHRMITDWKKGTRMPAVREQAEIADRLAGLFEGKVADFDKGYFKELMSVSGHAIDARRNEESTDKPMTQFLRGISADSQGLGRG